MISNIGKESFFPLVCLVSTAISLVSIYLFECQLKLGIYSYILGLSVQTCLQIIFQLIIISYYCPIKLLVFPKWKDLTSNNGHIFSFILKYSLAFLLEYASYELISFILLLSKDPSGDMEVWSAFAQLVNIIYFIGYGVSSFVRAIGTRLLALNRPQKFKKVVFKSCLYMSILMITLSVIVQFLVPQIASLFVTGESQLSKFDLGFRIFSFCFFIECLYNVMASTLRLLNYPTYVVVCMIIFMALSFPISCLFSVIFTDSGVVGCVVSLVVIDTILAVLFVFRYFYNLDHSVQACIVQIEKTNSEFLLSDEVEEKSRSESGKSHENNDFKV